jgi:hypothetical protein
VTATSGSISGNASVTITTTPTTNIALNKPVTASSSQSGLLATSVNDGNTGTRWGSEWADPQWIKIDLLATYSISRVMLRWEPASAKSYQVQISNDNVNWINIYTTTTGDGGDDNLTVTGSGRYIRMNGTVRNTGWGYSLWEFEVYGTASGARLSVQDLFGFNAPDERQSVEVFPNPVEDELTITGLDSYPVAIRLYSDTKEVYNKVYESGKESITLDLKHLSRGLYYLKILDGNKAEFNRRLIKK